MRFATGMAILNSSTWILLCFDVLGLWLLLRPSDLVNLWTAHRVVASDFDRFTARLVGVVALSTQVIHWVGQTKGTNAEPIMGGVAIIFAASAVVFLGYHFVDLIRPGPERRTQVDHAKRRFLLPESEEEARARYRAAWQRYRRLRVMFPLAFLGWLPFGAIVGAMFRFFHLGGMFWEMFLAILVLAWVPSIPIFGWQWSFWQCPRCGYAFKGIYDLFFPKHCHYCELPMWAESPDA